MYKCVKLFLFLWRITNSRGKLFFYSLLVFWFPPGRGDLDGEVSGREEGEDYGCDVVAAVVHALAEYPHDFLES